MIARNKELSHLRRLLRRYPAAGIIGARQVGKTTLAREFLENRRGPGQMFDLEDPQDRARLREPLMALEELTGLVVIDEVQRMPEIYDVIRVLVDRPRKKRRYLVLGSASPELLRQSSESLAGRIVYHELKGFGIHEVGVENLKRLWMRGGFPRSYLSESDAASHEWRRGFIATFLERDLPLLGVNVSSETMRRFWTMLAHYHGQTWNASEIGRSFGVADTTVRSYLDRLTASLVVRQLAPWHENLSKRQVKSPKVYLADSGLLHALLNIRSSYDLAAHPKVGASWEGFAIDQITRQLGAGPEECFFWATHSGAELDLLVVRGRRRWGFEIKHTLAPTLTRSMRNALADLKPTRLDVIHAGDKAFPLGPKTRAIPLTRIADYLKPLR